MIHAAEILRGSARIDLLKGGTPFTVLRRETDLDQRMPNGMLTATMAAEGLSLCDVLHVAFSATRKDLAPEDDVPTFPPPAPPLSRRATGS